MSDAAIHYKEVKNPLLHGFVRKIKFIIDEIVHDFYAHYFRRRDFGQTFIIFTVCFANLYDIMCHMLYFTCL